MAAKKIKTTRADIIRCASEFFFEQGYSATTSKIISKALDIYIGNITYYFPTKEHLLAVFAQMLCDYHLKTAEERIKEGLSPIMAICLEFAAMVAVCEENEIAKDFYISSYLNPLCLSIIRKNDIRRARKLLESYRPDWNQDQFEEAEILISGIEYSTLISDGVSLPLETKITGALDNILSIYGVPEKKRKEKINSLMEMDYREIGRNTFEHFKEYIKDSNKHIISDFLEGVR